MEFVALAYGTPEKGMSYTINKGSYGEL